VTKKEIEIEKRKVCEENGGKEGPVGKQRRGGADEVMGDARRRGIGESVKGSFPGQTGPNNYVMAVLPKLMPPWLD